MQTISNYLLFLAIPFLAAYFYQFFKTIMSIDEAERKRYIESGSKWNFVVVIPFVVAILYFKDVSTLLAIALIWILFLAVGEYWHQKKLKALEFNPAIQRRLLRLSYLCGIAVVMVLTSLILSANAT